MSNASELDFGFGSVVQVEIHGHDVDGEIIATPYDNRDLDDGQYIVALGFEAEMYDELSSEEIIHEKQIFGVIES
jgi:hypothetical protein